MTNPRILIACIGNIFLGDDGFGVEVARRLEKRALPDGVVLRDFGIRGYDLAYALLEPYDLVLLVDACGRGGEPGTVYVIEPDLAAGSAPNAVPLRPDAHGMDPASVLAMVKAMGGAPRRLLIVGCEPADLGPEEGKLGLSDVVATAAGAAADLLETLVLKELDRELMDTQPQLR